MDTEFALASRRKVLLAEYTALKSEQQARIGTRDNLLYATLVALAGVFTLAGTAGRLGYVLLAAPATAILGWTYLANDLKISAAGAYLRDQLAPALGELAGSPVLGWETAHRAHPDRSRHKAVQLAIDLQAFALPGIVPPLAYLVLGHPSAPLILAAVADLVTGAGMTVLVWRVVSAAFPAGNSQDTANQAIGEVHA